MSALEDAPAPAGPRDPLSQMAERWRRRSDGLLLAAGGGEAFPPWQVLASCAAELEQALAVIRAGGAW